MLDTSNFLVESKNGTLSVVRDRYDIPEIPEPYVSRWREKRSSLKNAWQECFNAILLGDKNTASKFFALGVPQQFQIGSFLGGFARVLLTTSNSDDVVRAIVEFNFYQPNNGTLRTLDAQIWKRMDHGEWRVYSVMFQSVMD